MWMLLGTLSPFAHMPFNSLAFEQISFVHAGMPIAGKYLNFTGSVIGAVFGNVTVAWAIYAGLNQHGAQTKDDLEFIGKGVKAGLEAHLEAGLEKLGKQLSQAPTVAMRAPTVT